MPWAPRRDCAQPGCREKVRSGYCERHRRDRERARGSPTRRGLGADHRRLRDQAIAEWTATNGLLCPGWGVDPHLVASVRDLTGDHIVPRSRGGQNVLGNYQVLCGRCNYRRGTR